MSNDKLLKSLSQHMAYWYTCVQEEKDIIFPVNKVIKEEANKLFRKRYQSADTIISETGNIYKIAKEICCESNKWSYTFYLDDMNKNYNLKKNCAKILKYSLNATNHDKLKTIQKLKIPGKLIIINTNSNEIKDITNTVSPYLKTLAYINTKAKQVIAYPDIIVTNTNQIILFLNYYHHHHMNKRINKIKKALNKYLHIYIKIKNNK